MMCPLTCEIVKMAIEEHEKSGMVMGMFVDTHKHTDGYCSLCTRNEYALSPIKDMGVQEGEE